MKYIILSKFDMASELLASLLS